MPTYITPSAIDVAINLQVGRIEVVAGDRTDTVVTVLPTNPGKAVDRRGADDTKVEFDGQLLTITGPKPRLSWIGPGPNDSTDVRIELPTGSRLTAEIAVGNVVATGRLGATRIKSSTGSVDVDTTGDLWLRAGHGNATVARVDGSMELTADHGQIRLGTVTGDAILKASHGTVTVGQSGGALEAKLSYGDLEIGRALASVAAKTAYGNIELREVSGGAIEVESGFGQITIGVRPGVPVWLDLSTKDGHVRNEITADAPPEASEQSVSVRAHTQFSDITIRRAR